MLYKKWHWFTCLLVCLMSLDLAALTIGSDSRVTRVGYSFFPASQTNTMLGFSFFEKGFALENASTVCTYDGLYGISGNIVLNSGNVQLRQNLVCQSPFTITPGTITGNNNSVSFVTDVSTISLPTQNHEKLLTVADQIAIGDYVNSVDWSFDSQYVAMVSSTAGGVLELQVFSFDGTTLTQVASQNLDQDVYAVRWHPIAHYLAVGQNGNDELKIFFFDTGDDSLTQIDSANISKVCAVAWNPVGTHVVVGENNSSQLRMYPVTAGVLGTAITYSFGSSRRVQLNALDWDTTGAYLAVGLERKSGDTELKVLYFNGSTLALNASVETGTYVYAVAWQPGTSLLAIGDSSSSTPLKLYDHNFGGGTLTLRSSMKADALGRRRIYAANWNTAGTHLAIGKQRDSRGHEVQVFSFDNGTSTFDLVSGYKVNNHVYAIRWSPNDQYLAVGDRKKNFSVLDFTQKSFTVNTVRLLFDSDVDLRTSMTFQGSCLLSGEGNVVDLTNGGEIIVASGATLRLSNVELRGISGTNIRCADNTGIIILENVTWVQSANYTFATGALQFDDVVNLSGNGVTCAYQSDQVSTFTARSTVNLRSNFTLSYEPAAGLSKDLWSFADSTACLVLDNATLHADGNGLNLKKGKMRVRGNCSLSTDFIITSDGLTITVTDEGTTFGDGVSGTNDYCVDILGNGTLEVAKGVLNYKNVNAGSWGMRDTTSILKIDSKASLHLFDSLNLGVGEVKFVGGISLIKEPGKNLIGTINVI